MQNVYQYHTLLETFKLMKTHTPISIFSCFTKSQRKETLLISPTHSHNFLYKASSLWNSYRAIPGQVQEHDFSAGIGYTKNKIKELLFMRQKIGDREEWADENFNLHWKPFFACFSSSIKFCEICSSAHSPLKILLKYIIQ